MSFIEELKRRNVVKVGVAYLVASWLLLQLTEVLTELLELDTDIGKMVILLLVVGFIPAVIFAWAFELTPEGIKRESEVDRSESVTRQTGNKLNIAVIAMLAMIAGYFIWEARFKAEPAPGAATVAEAVSAEPTQAASGPAAETPTPEIEADAIAVLPFANRSARDDDLFFTDGIHDDLLTQLAKISGLKVISRTSVRAYRDSTKNLSEIAAELGVSKILEGGVQRAGDRIRINAQLIDVTSDQHLWAETFDREMTIDNIFDIQSEITTQIVTAVKGEITDADRETLTVRPTDNLAAWEAFLQARAIVAEADYSADKYQRAEPFALEAVRLDPNFAEAWAELAGIQMQGVWIGYANTAQQRAVVRQSLDRAEALDPTNPLVIAALADYHYRIEVDYAASLARLDRALELAPGNALLHRDRALSLRRLGRWEESIAAFERSLDLDPLNAFDAATMIETLIMMNAWERVEPLTDFWLLRAPESGDLLSYKAGSLISLYGDVEAASELMERHGNVREGRAVGMRIAVAAMRRDWDHAIDLIDTQGQFANPVQLFRNTPEKQRAAAHSFMGDLETSQGHWNTYIAQERSNPATGRLAQGLQTISLAEAHAWLGDSGQAMAYADEAVDLVPMADDHVFGAYIRNQRIWVLAKVGQRDAALALLDDTLDQPEGFMRWFLHLHPRWDFFRDDPRFNELVRPPGIEPNPFQRPGNET